MGEVMNYSAKPRPESSICAVHGEEKHKIFRRGQESNLDDCEAVSPSCSEDKTTLEPGQ